MPAAPTTDFSFERDISPYASKFFSEIGADRSMSPEQKQKLQGTLLGGMQGIEEQRMKLQEERDQGRMRKLAYDRGVLELEEARSRRVRLEQQGNQVIGAHTLVKGILASGDDPMTKAQKLAEAELENAPIAAGNPDVAQVFGIARNAIPEPTKPAITSAERWSAALKGIPQGVIDEALATGNMDLIAVAAADAEAQKEAATEAKRLRLAKGEDAERFKFSLATAPLKFQKDEASGEASGWLEPESTQKATSIVMALGTPAEQARFEALKGAESDHARADLVEKIQLREQLRVAQVTGGSGRKSASSVTGL